MNKVLELFGHSTFRRDKDWEIIAKKQLCPFLGRKCYKVRKSDPDNSIGTCTVLHGLKKQPILICPTRLIARRQVFTDCLHLLTTHEPGNEFHIVSEVPIPGGSVDYFVLSVKDGKVRDFVGVELQTLDTTGTIWPERQRLLRELGVPRQDETENWKKPFGMNWKMTAKTILLQMHHKIQTFENVNKKLVLAAQDRLLEYMVREFNFSHMKREPAIGDSMHFHAYRVKRQADDSYGFVLDSRLSTDAEGISIGLGLQTEAKVKITEMIRTLEKRISPETLFTPM